eukprot:m.120433 g.120433  ORF g.120433 m.120433 type:complete len:52 (+) comp52077_c0_seq17:153-308(+)
MNAIPAGSLKHLLANSQTTIEGGFVSFQCVSVRLVLAGDFVPGSSRFVLDL